MAIYRPIQISFWQDDFIINLTPEEKYFYIYLLTNSKTTQCGIYEISIRLIAFETGYNDETIRKLLQSFVEKGKILFSEENMEIMITNWIKYNKVDNNANLLKCVESELQLVKTKEFTEVYRNNLRGLKGLPEEKETETPPRSNNPNPHPHPHPQPNPNPKPNPKPNEEIPVENDGDLFGGSDSKKKSKYTKEFDQFWNEYKAKYKSLKGSHIISHTDEFLEKAKPAYFLRWKDKRELVVNGKQFTKREAHLELLMYLFETAPNWKVESSWKIDIEYLCRPKTHDTHWYKALGRLVKVDIPEGYDNQKAYENYEEDMKKVPISPQKFAEILEQSKRRK